MRSWILNFSVAILCVLLVCANANAGSWITESAGGFSRVNKYVPDTVSEVGEGRSLLIVLHGCTQDINSFRTANLDLVAEEFGMVIAVPDAMNKQGFSCWGYWTGQKSRTSGDYKNVINLAKEYKDDPGLDIDPNQVYISGFSSGGEFAKTTWCLAPDVFAGLGTVGIGFREGGSFETAEYIEPNPIADAQECLSLAGSRKDYFDAQKVSVACGTSDYTIDQGKCVHTSLVMANVIGATDKVSVANIDDMAEETLRFDSSGFNRVSLLRMFNVGHAWPGGAGATGSYIDGNSINYGEYLAEFFQPTNIVPCQVNLSGFETKESYVIKQDGGVSIAGKAEVMGGCKFDSIILTINGQKLIYKTSEIEEIIKVQEGENLLQIEAKAIRNNGVEVVANADRVFEVKYEAEIPAWCNFFPEKYWKWMPSCAAGL